MLQIIIELLSQRQAWNITRKQEIQFLIVPLFLTVMLLLVVQPAVERDPVFPGDGGALPVHAHQWHLLKLLHQRHADISASNSQV